MCVCVCVHIIQTVLLKALNLCISTQTNCSVLDCCIRMAIVNYNTSTTSLSMPKIACLCVKKYSTLHYNLMHVYDIAISFQCFFH